jgi:hypothetical protein
MYICSILVFTPCYEVNHSVTTERHLRWLTANSSPGQAFKSSEVNRGKGFGLRLASLELVTVHAGQETGRVQSRRIGIHVLVSKLPQS